MRRRLIVSYLLLMGLVLVALEIPLGLVLVSRETQKVAADRLADATRFAALAAPALRTGDLAVLGGELARYYQVYGIRSAVVDLDRQVVASAGGLVLDDRAALAAHEALTRRLVSSAEMVWPWRDPPLITAAPATNGGEVLGAVVTISPTGKLRGRVRSIWLALAGAGLLAVLACVLTAFGLARWVLKPVTELAAAADRIGAGEHGARVPQHIGPVELRRLAAGFNEMADSVTEALERQRSFVAHASHQLRNPLTALRLRVEELGLELTTDAARTEQELALSETDRLGHVLDGLLALARAGRGPHPMVTVDALAVAESRISAWKPLADRRGIALKLVAGAGPLPVRAVATALGQALDALVDNALKFTPAGDEGRVVVSIGVRDGGVLVRVRDNGPGLTRQQALAATEPFWRAPDAQNIDGAGLGLPIARVLIEASGGRIELAPAQPHGLEARVWLPGDHDS